MATTPSGAWGIDVGQCGVKAIRLQVLADGTVAAAAFDYIEYPKILTQPDADPDQLTREALEQFLSRNSIRGDVLAISVPGQSGLARFVKLPPVEEKKIADIVRFEAKQQIPFPLEEVVWDYQKLGSGEVADGFAMGTEIGLFALKRDMVFRYLQHFKDVNVEVHTVQMAPLALCNFVAYDLITKPAEGEEVPDKKQCIVALDIGTDNSNLVITDGDRIIWQRPIPLGGNTFTRALTKDMKLTFAKAEHLKRNAIKSPELKKILSSLKTVLNDFVGEVQRSLGYFTNTHRDAAVQYMIGLGNAFRLPGLQKYLQEKLQLEVRKFTKLERVQSEEVMAAPTFVENMPSFAVAYGLALQGIEKTRLATNLLPYEVRVERLVRSKKPWAVAAAACLMLAVGGLTFARSVENAAVSDPALDAAAKEVDQEKAKAKQLNDTAAAEKAKLAAGQRAIDNLAAGVEERWNWQLLHQYINLCLPQPDGARLHYKTGLAELPRKKYDNEDSAKAYLWLEEKRFADPRHQDSAKQKEALETMSLTDVMAIAAKDHFYVSEDAFLKRNEEFQTAKKLFDNAAKTSKDEVIRLVRSKKEEFISKHLIQVSIEGISSRFTDDLSGYYNKIYQKDPKLNGMDLEERENVIKFTQGKDASGLPWMKKGCWVIEIRGYTYHESNWNFVQETFLENLNKPWYLDNKYRHIEDLKDGDRYPNDRAKDKLTVDPKIHKDILKKIRDRMSNVFIFQYEVIPNPGVGNFKIAGKSILETVVDDGQPVVAAPVGKDQPNQPAPPPDPKGAPPPAAGKDPAPVAAQVKSRVGWRPLGGVGGAAVAKNPPQGQIAPQPLNPNPPKADPNPAANNKNTGLTRTEFIILFVWREPFLNAPSDDPVAQAGNPATPAPPPPPGPPKK